MIKQISITLPNEPGKMSEISDLMGAENINIRAILLDEKGKNSGVLRVVVDRADKAKMLLDSKGYKYEVEDVHALVIPDHPGGLSAVLKPLRDRKINVNFLYAAIGRYGTSAIVILGVDKNEEAIKALKGNYFQLLGDEVYKL